MKMIHKDCGGDVIESKTLPPYNSEEHGFVPAYECIECKKEILGDSTITLIPENVGDIIQVMALEDMRREKT